MQEKDCEPRDEAARRVRAAWRVRACAAAMAVGAQVFLSGAGAAMLLCLNAAWLAALAALPASALAAWVCRRALRRGGLRRKGMAVRVLHLLLCGAFVLCAVWAAVSLVNLAEQSLLPQTRAAHSVGMTMLAVFLCALSGGTGAPRLAFSLRFLLPAVLAALCAAALPPRSAQGLFPWLGAGAGPLALGAACMTGAAFPVLMLLYPPPELEQEEVLGQAMDVPDARFFMWRVLLGAAAGAALLLVLVLSSTYEGIARRSAWGERLLLMGGPGQGKGLAQTGITLAQMLGMLLLAVNMLLCAQQAMAHAFERLRGRWGLALCTSAVFAALFALLWVGFDAALVAVPMLCAAFAAALTGAWALTGKEETHAP